MLPPAPNARIEKITARIRALCSNPFTLAAEAELKKLARELKLAIKRQEQMAKTSLPATKAALQDPDPQEE